MIYFDNAATTFLCQPAKEVLCGDFANANSPHKLGLDSARALKSATAIIADIFSCANDEIIFTSGGTESNNLGILGAAFALKSERGKNNNLHILATAAEHPSVTEPLHYLNSLDGFSVEFVPFAGFSSSSKNLQGSENLESSQTSQTSQKLGFLETLQAKITAETALICTSHVNSETGDILADLSALNKRNALVFVDGAQGFCKLPIPKFADIYSFSGHKIHAPTGVGGLFVRKGIRLQPLLHGSGQQRQIKPLRPGTENVSGIVAMSAACKAFISADKNHVSKIKQILSTLKNDLADVTINQVAENSESFEIAENAKFAENVSDYILNISFFGIPGETLTNLLSAKGLYISTGAACRSADKAKRLAAAKSLGISQKSAESAVRLSFSYTNTEEEAVLAKQIMIDSVTELRNANIRRKRK